MVDTYKKKVPVGVKNVFKDYGNPAEQYIWSMSDLYSYCTMVCIDERFCYRGQIRNNVFNV